MTDIKRFIKTLFYFATFSSISYIILVIIGGTINMPFISANVKYIEGPQGDLFYRTNEISYFKNVDVLFSGSSHTYRGFDTRIFKDNNLGCFNLGSSTQTPLQTEVLLKRYLDSLNPKTIVFEVSPIVFSSDGIESTLDLIKNTKNDIYTITKLITFNNINTLNTAIFGFYKDLFKDKYIVKDSIRLNKDLYITGGFVQRDMAYYKPETIEKSHIIVNDKMLEIFDRIINNVRSKGINVILVQTPITKVLYNSYSNINAFDSIMSKYGNYYNFNEILELTDSVHFYDEDHLNQKGVVLFDNKFIEVLEL
ncbi:MAG: hypothetical protein KAG84_05760 [Bacteroidales bacterium]|nr:hypothetical protein [Bacteroidales bacterium]